MLKSIKIWKIDEDASRIVSKLTISNASRFAFTEDGMIVNDIIIDTTYISESVIMSILEPKVYHEIAGETFYTNFIIHNQRLVMEVDDKVFIYCYNFDNLPHKTPRV